MRRATSRADGVLGEWDDFNPRSPCGERLGRRRSPQRAPQFQSTLSLRRATLRGCRVGRTPRDFNPRSPCGERRDAIVDLEVASTISIHALLAESDATQFRLLLILYKFQSTLSLRRATQGGHPQGQCLSYFNPRSPCGERRELLALRWEDIDRFQSTLSLRRATRGSKPGD